ncbi:hypothetical protein HWV23_03940 [Natronomonas halophila]|uniref:hypothetical protein n=1 Tax=Natronomonas halophila TaxID=2747817 RepID=UPI0015B3B1DE|nr:hypothetical protein [Natronomonas halophila]QLD84903.1 hypothetical protein HWV23_03940 [Natronomonas halophila]
MADDDTPTFAIPERPVRRYPRRGGVEYDGETVFLLTPADDYEDPELASLVEAVLEDDLYRYGDWFDLPMPLYLVHDEETGDTFRVAVRDGRIEFHVLPNTDSAGLRALYERLVARSETAWHVRRRAE